MFFPSINTALMFKRAELEQMGVALVKQQTALWCRCASAAATGDIAAAAGRRAAEGTR
jgi:hypothetical protein